MALLHLRGRGLVTGQSEKRYFPSQHVALPLVPPAVLRRMAHSLPAGLRPTGGRGRLERLHRFIWVLAECKMNSLGNHKHVPSAGLPLMSSICLSVQKRLSTDSQAVALRPLLLVLIGFLETHNQGGLWEQGRQHPAAEGRTSLGRDQLSPHKQCCWIQTGRARNGISRPGLRQDQLQLSSAATSSPGQNVALSPVQGYFALLSTLEALRYDTWKAVSLAWQLWLPLKVAPFRLLFTVV